MASLEPEEAQEKVKNSISKSESDRTQLENATTTASSTTSSGDVRVLRDKNGTAVRNIYLSVLFRTFIGLGVILILLPLITSKYSFNGYSYKSPGLVPPPEETYRKILDLTFLPGSPIEEKNRTQIGMENATLFMLVRNIEVQDALDSIRQVEDRFNRNYRYPWVFLNDDDFTEEVSILKEFS